MSLFRGDNRKTEELTSQFDAYKRDYINENIVRYIRDRLNTEVGRALIEKQLENPDQAYISKTSFKLYEEGDGVRAILTVTLVPVEEVDEEVK